MVYTSELVYSWERQNVSMHVIQFKGNLAFLFQQQ